MTMTTAFIPGPRVAGGTPNPPKPYELAFYQFLSQQDIAYAVEPDRLLHGPQKGDGYSGRGTTPDIRLGNSFDGYTVYLELTEADVYDKPDQLAPAIRRRNRSHADSRRAYISPAEYLERKARRIRQTMDWHPDVVIVLLTMATITAIYAQPELLPQLVNQACAARQPVG